MSDLISRQAAIDAIDEYIENNRRPDFIGNMVWVSGVADAMRIVSNLPSVQERKKGRWIYADDCDNRYDSYWCSNCHHGITVDAERRCDIGFVIEDLKFCPNCGAHMGGEQGDND